MTKHLSDEQLTWLRGLATDSGYIPMSASELGNPAVSELQTRELVKIQWPDCGPREWRITAEGRLALIRSQRKVSPNLLLAPPSESERWPDGEPRPEWADTILPASRQ